MKDIIVFGGCRWEIFKVFAVEALSKKKSLYWLISSRSMYLYKSLLMGIPHTAEMVLEKDNVNLKLSAGSESM